MNKIYLSIAPVIITLLMSTKCNGQYVNAMKNKVLTIDASFAALNQQYDNNPLGKSLALGFRMGISRIYSINSNIEAVIRINYSQSASQFFRVYPTGVLDTTNIYNSIKIYKEKERLHYSNLKIGIKKLILKNTSTRIYLGVNSFIGLLLAARNKGKELSGSSEYNNDASGGLKKFNAGIEPEIMARIYLADGSFLSIIASHEIGLSNILKYPQSFAKSEFTRAYCLTINFPF